MTNIKLPKDAEGREIPLGTKVLYDEEGNELCAKVVEFRPFSKEWSFAVQKGQKGPSGRPTVYRRPRYVYLEKPALPDSWEKLEEDLDKCIEKSNSCWYFSPGGDCFRCARPDSDTCGCTASVFKDIKRRIRKLRGEG